jgi:hypothetical protein
MDPPVAGEIVQRVHIQEEAITDIQADSNSKDIHIAPITSLGITNFFREIGLDISRAEAA